MDVVSEDLWAGPSSAWRVVPTNLVVRRDGTAVMGAGVALQAAERFPGLSARYGKYLQAHGQQLFYDAESRVICLPTKIHWRQPSDRDLVVRGLRLLRTFAIFHPDDNIRLPMLGAGLGRLPAGEVRQLIQAWVGKLPNVTLVLAGAAAARIREVRRASASVAGG